MATYTSNYAWTKPSGGDPVDIEVLNDNLDDQDSIVHQAFLDLAPVFSTANTYAVKDVVLYDNKVWICHTAVTTAGAWTGSTNWSQTTVGETGGVATYADLPDKPSINGNELSGNKTGAQLGLQNALTFDNVPTANSTNPVKSGGVYSADEAIRKWTTAEAKSVSGNPITLTDGSARKAEGLVVTCNPKQNLHGYDHPWAGGAGKNKLPMTVAGIKAANTSGSWSGNEYTLNGVTFTVQTDADENVTGIKVNAPNDPSVHTIFNLAGYSALLSLNGQSVILSGCVSNGSLDTTYLQFYLINGEGRNITDIGAGSENFTPNITSSNAMVRIIVKKAISNAMFYPMIRLASVSDATFAPYSNECPITGYTECVVDRAGKNMLPLVLTDIKSANTSGTWSGNAYTLNGVTFTVQTDTDGKVTGIKLNGTSSADWVRFNLASYTQKAGSYIVNGVTGGTDSTYRMEITGKSGTITNGDYSYTINEDTVTQCYIIIRTSGTVCNNVMIYPMVRLSTVSDATFVPYSYYNVTIAFGQTIYGAIVNPKIGKVAVTDLAVTFTGASDENWTTRTTAGGFTLFELGNMPNCNVVAPANVFSNYRVFNNNLDTNNSFRIQGNTLAVRMDGLTLEQYKTFLASNPFQVCYPLYDATALYLTPAELELLKGYNYITTNGTTIALTYLPDSLLAEAENYVDAKIPPAPSSDGAYVLTCTVTDGTPAYSWESAT